MPKFTPNKSHFELMDVLSHMLVASHLDSTDGGKGFKDYYVKNVVTKRQQAMWTEFQRHYTNVKKDIEKLLEKDMGK